MRARPSGRPSRPGDRGGITVLVAGLVAAAFLLTGVVAAVAGLIVQTNHVGDTADFSALAAADAVRGLSEGDPCGRAEDAARQAELEVGRCVASVSESAAVVEVHGPATVLGVRVGTISRTAVAGAPT